MQLKFMFATRATVWFPPSSTPLTKQIEIPAKSVIQIKGAGLSYDGTIIADGHGYSLHIHSPHPGNINFYNDGEEVYGYKPFDPKEAEEFVVPVRS
jgi:hypothetical protein